MNTHARFWATILAISACVFAPSIVSAEIDFSQSTGDGATVQTAVFPSSNWYLFLGMLPSSSNGNVPYSLALSLSDNETDFVNIGIVCGTSPNLAGGCSGAWAGAVVKYFTPAGGVDLPSSTQTMSFASSTMPAYQSGAYYFLTMSRAHAGYSGTVTFKGSSTASSTCAAGCPTNTGQPFYTVQSTPSTATSTDTQIVETTNPSLFETTVSTTVDLQFTYISGAPTVTYAGVELVDNHVSQSIFVPEQSIFSSGQLNYSQSVTLTSGHAYTMRPYVRNTDGSVRIYGESVPFFVISNDWTSFIPSTEEEYEEIASTTEQVGQAPTVGGMLMERPPFLWFHQINSAYASSTQSQGEEMPSLTISMASTAIPFSVTMFSSTTLTRFIDQGTHDRFYGIMQAAVYAFGMYALYRRVQGAFNKDENEI